MNEVCKLCRSQVQLEDSHIIPEFMYSPMYDSKGKTVGYLKSGAGFRTHLLQKGLREKLLCRGCETWLNHEYEQPSLALWRHIDEDDIVPTGITRQGVKTAKGTSAVILHGVDYRSLKLLFLSVLWRAGVSARPEFKSVKLGPHEDILRRMVYNSDPGSELKYPFLLTRFKGGSFRGIVFPWEQRFEGHRAYDFLLSSIMVTFLVSHHAPSSPFSTLSVRQDGSFLIKEIDPSESKLVQSLRKLDSETRHSDSVKRALRRVEEERDT